MNKTMDINGCKYGQISICCAMTHYAGVIDKLTEKPFCKAWFLTHWHNHRKKGAIMGFVKKAVSSIFGGAPKVQTPQVVKPDDTGPSAAEQEAQEAKKARHAALAVQAGSEDDQNSLGVTTPGNVTKRKLLGL